MQSPTWTHADLTKGQPIIIKKLNLAGLKALVSKQLDVKSAGGQASPLQNVEIFEVMAYHTLRRSIPDLTSERMMEALEVDDLKTLTAAIVQANPDLQERSEDFQKRAA